MEFEGLQRDTYQNLFNGFDKRWLIGDGSLANMYNMSGRSYPHLATRPLRHKKTKLTKPNGLLVHDNIPIWVDGTDLYYDGTKVSGTAGLTDSKKELVVMGRRVLVFPDCKYYNFDPNRTEDAFGSLEASTGTINNLTFKNDFYAGEAAECNGVYHASVDFSTLFKVGDAVHISGCSRHADNSTVDEADRYIIVREISEDGHTLRFYPYSLTLNVGATVDGDGKIYIGGKKETPTQGTTYWFMVPEGDKYYSFSMPAATAGDSLVWNGSLLTWSHVVTTSTTSVVTVTALSSPGDADKEVSLTEYFDYVECGSFTVGAGGLAAGTYWFPYNNWKFEFTLSEALGENKTLCFSMGAKQVLCMYLQGEVGQYWPATRVNQPTGTELALDRLSISRDVPPLSHPFVHNNRLWGIDGNYIRCSALGDPRNFYKFDANISTGSWELEYMSEGAFTACCSYLGYPIFFKRREILKVMGYKPSNFETSSTLHCIGVEEGGSLAVAAGTLFYYGPTGFQSFQGSFPTTLHIPFDNARYTDVVAGSDGARYYASAKDAANAWHLFVYDTECRGWFEEDALHCLDIGRGIGVWMLAADGNIWNYDGKGTAETGFNWSVEWGDADAQTLDEKNLDKLALKIRLATGATATLSAMWDDGKGWMEIQTLRGNGTRVQTATFSPRRHDRFRLKLSGSGEMMLVGVMSRFSEGNWQRPAGKYGQL